MKEKPNYYAILSAEVRYDNRLRPNVKLLYAGIEYVLHQINILQNYITKVKVPYQAG